MAYLSHLGRILQNDRAVPMTLLARPNIDGSAIGVAAEHVELGARLDAVQLRRVLGPGSKVAMTFRGGTHDLWIP